MSATVRPTPARVWRAFFFLTIGLVLRGFAATPSNQLPELAQVGKPTPEEAAKLIEQFRNSGIPGDYYLDFELRTLPRRGESKTFKGRWWGSRNDQGAVTRVELMDEGGASHRLLLQNGERATVWKLVNGKAAEVPTAELMAPLIPGVEISAFDLQMPFLYWPGATVEKITRILGRPSHAFVFPAPAAFKAKYPDIAGARAYLDTQFNVPMQTEIVGVNGKITKTLALVSLKTVEKQTLPKAADYRNEITRDKTRLQVAAVALNLSLPKSVFDPASLSRPLTPPDRVVRLEP